MTHALFLLMLLPSHSHARAGVEDTQVAADEVETKRKATTTAGLCTAAQLDANTEYVARTGLCGALKEQLTRPGCTHDSIEKIRQAMLDEADRSGPFKDDKQVKDFGGLGFGCTSEDGTKGIKDIAKDPDKFAYVIAQFIMMITIRESDQNVLKDSPRGPKGPGGLLNLALGDGSVKDMDNKRYECGCREKVNTRSEQGGVTVQGQSPGPMDGQHSLTCGTYMALENALKDGTLFGGRSPASRSTGATGDGEPKDTREGAAKLFASLESGSKGFDGVDNREWYDKKMQTFCKEFWGKSGSGVQTWRRDDDAQQSAGGSGTNSAR